MRAAEYVRVSTDMQQYSILNQRAAIAEYAASRGFEVVKTYVDAAKSGLDIQHRPGLQSLIDDVLAENADFKAILVYDVSRWGRFQDSDEAACYEFLCRRAKIQVHYCAEPFSNDGSAAATVIKMIKRQMAAEYVRELSEKVFAGQCRLVLKGFKAGGTPGFGLRRLLLDSEGKPKMILRSGERKSIAAERVTYTLGPLEEVTVVREIFSMYLDRNMSATAIAEELNRRAIRTEGGGLWNFWIVWHMLRNPKYAGCLVFNRRSQRLRTSKRANSREQWIVRPESFPAIISAADFQRVQTKIADRVCVRSNQRLLDELRDYVQSRGKGLPRRASPNGLASTSTYTKRFGSIIAAYKLIGFPWSRNTSQSIQQLKTRAGQRTGLWKELRRILRDRGIEFQDDGDMLHLEDLGPLRLALGIPFENLRIPSNWRVNTRVHKEPHALIVARIGFGSDEVSDFVFLAQAPLGRTSFRLTQESAKSMHVAFPTLEGLIDSEICSVAISQRVQ